MINENRDLAIKLAHKAFAMADLDIVSSSVALRFLCRAELLNKNYDFDKIVEFLKLSYKNKETAERQAKHLLKQKKYVIIYIITSKISGGSYEKPFRTGLYVRRYLQNHPRIYKIARCARACARHRQHS
jgi:hypothetical protein